MINIIVQAESSPIHIFNLTPNRITGQTVQKQLASKLVKKIYTTVDVLLYLNCCKLCQGL